MCALCEAAWRFFGTSRSFGWGYDRLSLKRGAVSVRIIENRCCTMQSEVGIPMGKSARVRTPRGLRWRLVGGMYYAGLCTAPFAVGGLCHLICFETPGPNQSDDAAAANAAVALALILVSMVLVAAIFLYRLNRRRLAFGTVWCLCLMAAFLMCVELAIRLSMPPWPALGLHGVAPEVARTAWAHTETADDGINDWGQRDRHRTIDKASGVYRIAFVGDSFLEESSGLPLSSRVETKIGRSDVEVINLSRFELFIPEKRPFFLEGSEMYRQRIRQFQQLGEK